MYIPSLHLSTNLATRQSGPGHPKYELVPCQSGPCHPSGAVSLLRNCTVTEAAGSIYLRYECRCHKYVHSPPSPSAPSTSPPLSYPRAGSTLLYYTNRPRLLYYYPTPLRRREGLERSATIGNTQMKIRTPYMEQVLFNSCSNAVSVTSQRFICKE